MAVTVCERRIGVGLLGMCVIAATVFLTSCSPTQEQAVKADVPSNAQATLALASWLSGRGAVHVNSVRNVPNKNEATAQVDFSKVHLKDAHGHAADWSGKAEAHFVHAADGGWILMELDPVTGIQGIDSEPVGIKFENIGIEAK